MREIHGELCEHPGLASPLWMLEADALFSLTMSDQTPNVGLAWYFFEEMFPHFRNFFLGVYHVRARYNLAQVDD